ncbi:CHAT domain-containing protein [Mesorhizobium comanense]|uniref:CHAT domain-containing protein n=1 Tax=Mesorhizobium comanense TaxID=2502215 RepID=UPI0014857E04|nr:CHAT domain-containing protein [Mesorhizobium comanense]
MLAPFLALCWMCASQAQSDAVEDFSAPLASDIFYKRYLEALDKPDTAADAVTFFVRGEVAAGKWMPPAEGKKQESGAASPEDADAELGVAGPFVTHPWEQVSVADIATLTRVATLAGRYEAGMEALRPAPAALQVAVAERLLEGTIDGRNASAAARLFEMAAEAGSPLAQSRLAFLYLEGLGVPKDASAARRWAKLAADAGEGFAIYQLARMEEADKTPAGVSAALALYQRFLSEPARFRGSEGPTAAALLMANRMMSPGAALSSEAAATAIMNVAEVAPDFALALARVNLCTGCGGVIDVDRAAEWLRLAHDFGNQDAGYELYLLLRARPDLALEPNEGLERLRAGGTEHIDSFVAAALEQAREKDGQKAVAGAARTLLDRVCEGDAGPCEDAARVMASGRLDLAAVAPGLAKLTELDSIQLVDILAAYGDFDGALARARRIAPTSYDMILVTSPSDQHARTPTFRRLVASRDASNLKALPEGFVPLLTFLSDNGDEEARSFLDTLTQRGAAGKPEPVVLPLDEARTAFGRVAARGGLSRAFVNAARDLSGALKQAEQPKEALRMELTALSAELQLNEIAGLSEGALQRDLTRVCLLSKASERTLALGSNDVGMVLAKDAVNTLQTVRAGLSSLPEHLQTCFSNLVADNYRWLADFFVRQNRLAEAESVLAMLKDFEAFQFVDRDADFRGRSYDTLPLSAPEQGLKTAIDTLRPPTTQDARRSEELIVKRGQGGLDDAETKELDTLQARLAEADAAYDKALDAIVEKAEALGRGEEVARIDALGSLQGYLRDEPEQPAVLHYLVLPDRLNIILTTAYDRKSVTIDQWDGQPFSEAHLNEEIQKLHVAMTSPSLDPKPQAQKLYDLLIAPFRADLDAVQTKLVLLSPDRRLRYIPFAALHDGKGYAVEHFEFAMLSDAGYEIAGRKTTGLPFAALGMTRAAEGFKALPGVKVEIDGIIKGKDGYGLFEGRALFDAAFNKDALADALRIGARSPAGVGVVHISSHFSLTGSDGSSFLLLGTGERLSLREIKKERRAFDFGRVDLLTLSACETGYVDPSLDGRELESLSMLTGSRGARAILASLWPVDDASTALSMQRFYEIRERGNMSKAMALALTQREFIAGKIGSTEIAAGPSIVTETAARGAISLAPKAQGGLSHPYYWAPFLLTGNWR